VMNACTTIVLIFGSPWSGSGSGLLHEQSE
jgi:hypothetical protein